MYQGSDNYGDNGLEYFTQFATAQPGSVLYEYGVRTVPEPSTSGATDNADNLAAAVRADVVAGNLPQVSWVVTDKAFSEHPDGTPEDGAYYLHGILNALNADPDVFNSTLVIVDYDENDGFFDHVPPPTPATGTADEFYLDSALTTLAAPGPSGVGFRASSTAILLRGSSTRGSRVIFEVSDHTSVIQFLEQWTAALGKPATCANISDWRRKVCGDLTNAFDFHSPVYGLPALPATAALPLDLNSQPTPTTDAIPQQEPAPSGGPALLPAEREPRLVHVRPERGDPGGSLVWATARTANWASHFTVYDNTLPTPSLADFPTAFPGQYTVDPSRSTSTKAVSGTVELGSGSGTYDLTVVGPNRFLRHFTGDTAVSGDTAQVQAQYEGPSGTHPILSLRLVNTGDKAVTFTVTHNIRPTARGLTTSRRTATRPTRWTRSRTATAGTTCR